MIKASLKKSLKNNRKFDIAIVGGGFQGLVLAYYLSKDYKVVLIEKEKELGGTISCIKIGGTYLEKYYHQFFTRDKNIFSLLNELNLRNKLEWIVTPGGFYFNKKIYKFVGPLDLLSFKPLRFIDKILFVFLMLKMKFIRDLPKYENLTAKKWIIENSNEEVYKKMFEPLIKNKFGDDENVSASWIISRVKLRSNARINGEKLGYLVGGLKFLIDELERGIVKNGSLITKNNPFIRFEIVSKKVKCLVSRKGKIHADLYISTIPPEFTFKKIKLPRDYSKKLNFVEYHGVVCAILGLKKSLSDLYWINVLDDTYFKAIVEHTNFQNKEKYSGMNIIYLVSYNPLNSAIWYKSAAEILADFKNDLEKILPGSTKDIKYQKLFREKYAGTISKRNLIKNLLPTETPLENLFIVGMFNTYPERGLELQTRLAKKLIEKIKSLLKK